MDESVVLDGAGRSDGGSQIGVRQPKERNVPDGVANADRRKIDLDKAQDILASDCIPEDGVWVVNVVLVLRRVSRRRGVALRARHVIGYVDLRNDVLRGLRRRKDLVRAAYPGRRHEFGPYPSQIIGFSRY